MKRVLYLNALVLAGIAAFGVYLLLDGGVGAFVDTVGGHLATFAVSALAACLVVLGGADRGASDKRTYLVAAALTFVNAMALTYAPLVIDGVPQFGVLNWIGKLLSLLFCVAIFALLPPAIRHETGILRLPRPDSRRATGIALGVFAALGVALSFSGSPASIGLLEAAVFQLTLPSLSEEFLFRGILLALFARVALSPWRVLGANVGWGVVASSMLFGYVHGFLYVPSAGFVFLWIPILATGLLGAAFAWLTVRSGSVWPAVVAHSLLNATGPILKLAGVA